MTCALQEIVAPSDRGLQDGCGRVIDCLRVSVTDRCDLRCRYCRTESPPATDGLLSDSERLEFITFLARDCGLRQVRFTGGEPLAHAGLVELIAATRSAGPALSIAMTTNGQQLADHAAKLHSAGLDRINVSVDSLDPLNYRALTGGSLERVQAGMDAAVTAGFTKIRVNCVVLRGGNHDELGAMVRWAAGRGFELRFLEAMPIGPAGEFNRDHFVSAREIRETLSRELVLTDVGRRAGATSHQYCVEIEGRRVEFGVIAPVSEPFCTDCRRMRITAAGRLFPCLLDSRNVDLLPLLRAHAPPAELRHAVFAAIKGKAQTGSKQSTAMIQLGG
jgi:GTP 3',8-cyclase